jgi:phage repressor protein C with HTH and peptisase S24 domain
MATETASALTLNPSTQHAVQQEVFQGYLKTQPETPDDLMRQFVFVPRHQVAASAGGGAVINDETVVDHLAFRRSWIAQTLGLDPLHLALIDARGDSMSPTIESGDLLLLDTRNGGAKSEGIYVINLAGALLVKRLRIRLSGTVEVMSDNPKYSSETISGSELDRLVLVGRVVWHGRKV